MSTPRRPEAGAISRAGFLRLGSGAAAATAAAAVLGPGPAGASDQVDDSGDANVKDYGAVGDGVANDTAAMVRGPVHARRIGQSNKEAAPVMVGAGWSPKPESTD